MNSQTHFSLPILSLEECRLVDSQVAYLRPFWINRHDLAPFFTLGAASYIDAQIEGQYQRVLSKFNPILNQHFDWLYDRVIAALEQILKAPVKLEERAAFPGFHIFLSHPFFELPIMSVHYDLQFDLIPWTSFGLNVDKNTHCSFTLAITLPHFGGGINLWDLQYEDSHTVVGGIHHYASQQVPRKIEYHPGEMFFHSGYRLHQIAASEKLQSNDVRLTLQGHAICGDEGWILYW